MRTIPCRLGLSAALLILFLTPVVQAGGPECTCLEGNACYHFLNAPVEPPNDPCSCPLCRAVSNGCPDVRPKGWDETCFTNGKMECFLRRHAASWKLSCSERLAGECACKNPKPHNCPQCGGHGEAWGEGEFETLRRQIEIERRLLGKRRKFILIRSPHFYLVTDIPALKIRLQGRTPRYRTMQMHEIAHIFIQRAEIAYQDFVRYFTGTLHLGRPIGIYLLDKENLKQEIALEYFGLPEPELFYGGDIKKIGGGYAWNGCAISKGKYREDHHLQHQMRHVIGHLLISTWIVIGGSNKVLPRWMYAGAGHWLSRLPAKYREDANFCAGEGREVKHRGEKWQQKLVAMTMMSRLMAIQRIFEVNALGGLDLEMHMRAWSWYDVWMEEDRERFIAFLTALREEKNHRVALKEAFGYDPEEFDRRWRDRILGKRPTVASTPEELDSADPDRPGAADRDSIRSEQDPVVLAAKIRALQKIDDPLTAATLVPLLRHEEALVRETILLVLSRSDHPAVMEYLRTAGLSQYGGIVRAWVARAIGNLGDKAAGDALLGYANDGLWISRAHVARALGLIGHEPAIPALTRMVRDKSQKVRIAAMDALARFGARAGPAWDTVADELGTGAWQVRSTAAECLGALEQMASVEPLVKRMEIETGRIRKDIRTALKRITHDDLGNNPEHWREWWEKEKERAGGVPAGPDRTKEPPKSEHTYGEEPTYYGLRVFSSGVGYVLDTSGSMAYFIELDPAWIKKVRREYPPYAQKFDLAQREIEASLKLLDPRTKFNLYFFRTVASKWKNALQPATPGNVETAVRRLGNEKPKRGTTGAEYRTNYVDAFREVLNLEKGDELRGNLTATPDTIYFLTDGKPTVGDIVQPDVLLEWFRELNRFARIHVNVITFGNLEIDPVFLRGLAEGNGGKYVQVPAKR